MAEFNPYLAPAADITPPPLVDEVPGTQLWRDGSRLVMDKTASLPARCIVCNAPATGQPLRRRLTWHPSAWYLLLLINILVYAIVSLIVRQTAVIHVGLCDTHRGRRRTWIAVAWTLVLAAVILPFILGGIADDDTMALGFVFAFTAIVVAALIGIFGARVVRATRIDATRLWLAGVSPELIAELPAWPSQPTRT